MKKLIGLALCLVSGLSYATNWVEYHAEGTNNKLYYDSDSVKIGTFNNGVKYIQVWEKVKYSELKNAGDDQKRENKYLCKQGDEKYCPAYNELKIKAFYDCWGDRFEYGKMIRYRNGNVVFGGSRDTINTFSPNGWIEVFSDSVGASTFKEICHAYRHRLK